MIFLCFFWVFVKRVCLFKIFVVFFVFVGFKIFFVVCVVLGDGCFFLFEFCFFLFILLLWIYCVGVVGVVVLFWGGEVGLLYVCLLVLFMCCLLVWGVRGVEFCFFCCLLLVVIVCFLGVWGGEFVEGLGVILILVIGRLGVCFENSFWFVGGLYCIGLFWWLL